MNEEQKYILEDLLKELEKKELSEIQAYLLITRVVGLIAATAGIGVVLLTMFIPGILMAFVSGFIFVTALRISLGLDVLKVALKKIIETKEGG